MIKRSPEIRALIRTHETLKQSLAEVEAELIKLQVIDRVKLSCTPDEMILDVCGWLNVPYDRFMARTKDVIEVQISRTIVAGLLWEFYRMPTARQAKVMNKASTSAKYQLEKHEFDMYDDHAYAITYKRMCAYLRKKYS